MLIQLPNGDWIDPKRVYSIRYLPREQGYSGVHPPRVVLHVSTNGFADIQCVEFESEEDAEAFRDKMAALCNSQ